MVARRLSEATIDVYTREARTYLDYLGSVSLDVKDATTDDLLHYFTSSHNEDLTKRTISKKLSAARSFHTFLQEVNIREDDPLECIDFPRIEQTYFKSVSYDEVEAIFSAIDISTQDPLRLRDRCMFELIYSCGLRVSELVSLKLSDYVLLNAGKLKQFDWLENSEVVKLFHIINGTLRCTFQGCALATCKTTDAALSLGGS